MVGAEDNPAGEHEAEVDQHDDNQEAKDFGQRALQRQDQDIVGLEKSQIPARDGKDDDVLISPSKTFFSHLNIPIQTSIVPVPRKREQ